MAAYRGWKKANGVDDKGAAPSDAEFLAAVAGRG